MPSSTRYSAQAARKSDQITGALACGARSRSATFRLRHGLLQVAEELAVRRDHDHVCIAPQRISVSLEAAIEAVRLRGARGGARVDVGRLRVALAAHALRVALRSREDFGALAICVRTHRLGRSLSFGAQLRRLCRKALLHAPVHGIGDFIRQIDTAHAYVYQLHTELLHGGACPAQQVRGDRGTLCGHVLLDGEWGDHALDAVLDDLAEPACCVFLYAARAPIERADISDAPLHVEIDVENLAFTREEALGREILRDEAPIELAGGTDKRHPKMQSSLVLSLQDLAEARADGEL